MSLLVKHSHVITNSDM